MYLKKFIFILKKYGYEEALLSVIRFPLWKIRDLIRFVLWSIFIKNRDLKIHLKSFGFTMYLNPHDSGISTELFLHKVHEPISSNLYLKLLQPNMIIIDIGANIGYYTLMAAKKKCKIYAFEPDPSNYEILEKNIKLNKFGANVQLYKYAISDKNGKISFYISEKRNWNSIIPTIQYENKIEADSITLDYFVNKNKLPKVDFIKMDIEGAEFLVIKGMLETLEMYKPKLFIEIHPRLFSGEKEKLFFFTYLNRLGYKIKYCVNKISEEYFFFCKLTTLTYTKDISIMDFINDPEFSVFKDYFILFLEP